MQITRLGISNFRAVESALLHFDRHTLLIGGNNVGKSTVCEALDLVLGPDRLYRSPPVEEFDFRNANYLAKDGVTPIPIRIEAVLTDLTDDVKTLCANNLEFWNREQLRLLDEGEIDLADHPDVEPCLRLITIAKYDAEDDQFVAKTVYGRADEAEDDRKAIPRNVKRSIGFLYLRAIRTGSRALSLERGSLLDNILRMKEARAGMWEGIRTRLETLSPPIDADATELGPILEEIETRLSDYIAPGGTGRATRLFVSQLTREHLRKTISFFLSMGPNESAVPFQRSGTGTLNTLVLALLTFIADIKKDNVIFAMEEPEIALPPHTQRRIANYLLKETSQCFVTSHSPYVIEHFEPNGIIKLKRDLQGKLTGQSVALPVTMRAKSYRHNFRRALAEAMLSRGVIIGEGVTEQDLLLATAHRLESSDDTLFPFDVAGVCVVNADGDGNLEKMGEFFKAIDIPAFAFYDKKKRSEAETAALSSLFVVATEIPFKGSERLIVNETPLYRQWEYLVELRDNADETNFKIPSVRPEDERLRDLTCEVLKAQKGDGGAARLLNRCAITELPATPRAFLEDIYSRFPRPKRKPKTASVAENDDWLSLSAKVSEESEGD